MKVLLEKVALFKIIFIIFFLSCAKNLSAADKSLSFDGTDDFVQIAANSVLNPTGDYTVAAWFKQEGNNTANTWQSVITSRMKVSNGNAKGYVMYLRPTTNYLDYWKGHDGGGSGWESNLTNSQSTWKTNGGGDPGTPGWNYWVIRFNGSDEMDLFLDGVLIKSLTSSRNLNRQNTTRPTRIGAGTTEDDTAQFFFNGKIDDVAVWDEALTDAEISALYNSGETLYAKENYGDYSSKDNLVAYYTMDSDNGSGTTLSDDEGSNNGSFNGAPAWSTDTPGTAPTITSFTPTDDSTFVDVNTNIVLNFSEIVRGTSSGNVTIKKASDNSVVEEIAGNSDKVSGSLTTQITINPSTTLDINTEYYVLVEYGAFADISNNSVDLLGKSDFSFTTNQNPSLSSSNPSDNATGVAADTDIILNFSDNVDAESGNISIYKSIDGSLVEEIDVTSGQVSGSGTSQITVNPSSDLESGVEYYILIDSTAFDDSLSNSYAGISNAGDLSFRVLTSSNPIEDKNVTGLLDTQTDMSNVVFKQTIAPVSNRLKYLRRNRNSNDLTNQKVKLKLPINNTVSKFLTEYTDVLAVSSKIEEKVLPKKWSSWSEGLYSVTTIGDDRDTNSRKIRSNSFAFGIDKKVSKNQFYGYAFQYGKSDSNINKTGTSADSENYHFSWYGSKPHSDKNFVEGSVGFGLLETDLIRTTDTNRLTGSRNGGQVFGTINYGRYLSKGNIEVIPRVGLDLGYTELSAYTETGTDALSYSSQFIRSGLATLGLEFNNLLSNEKNSFKTFGSIDYGLDFSDTSEAKINYLSDTSTIYTYKGSNNSSHWFNAELGFDYIVKDTLTISSSYNRKQGSDDEHSDTVKFRFHFTPERETEYAMQFDVNEDPSAGFNIAKNIYGLDFNFKLDQEFNENLDKSAEISMIKKF